MAVFILRRSVQAIVTLLLLTIMVFTLARLTGDPTPLVLPSEATEADRTYFRQQYGLDRSLPGQYAVFLGNVLQGDFGVSFRFRTPAMELVVQALIPTLQLTLAAMVVSILIGVPLGIAAAYWRGSFIDRFVNLFASFGQAVPTFWLGLMLIIAFAINIPLLPSSGYGTAAHYVLPVMSLSLFASSSIARLTQSNMREALRSDFVQMERVLGLRERSVVLRHALRNAALPIITYLGLQFGLLLGGAIVTERVFAWPGIGQAIVDAIFNRDYPVVQAAVLVTGAAFVVINAAVDMICMVLDPRVGRV